VARFLQVPRLVIDVVDWWIVHYLCRQPAGNCRPETCWHLRQSLKRSFSTKKTRRCLRGGSISNRYMSPFLSTIKFCLIGVCFLDSLQGCDNISIYLHYTTPVAICIEPGVQRTAVLRVCPKAFVWQQTHTTQSTPDGRITISNYRTNL
jgi:hypothetical protein